MDILTKIYQTLKSIFRDLVGRPREDTITDEPKEKPIIEDT